MRRLHGDVLVVLVAGALGTTCATSKAQQIQFDSGSFSGQVTASGFVNTFDVDTGQPVAIFGYPRPASAGGFGVTRNLEGTVGANGSTSGGLGFDEFEGLAVSSLTEINLGSSFDAETGVAKIRIAANTTNFFGGLSTGRTFGYDRPDGSRGQAQIRFTSGTITPGVSLFTSFTMPGTEPRPFFVRDGNGQVLDPSELGPSLANAGSMLMPGTSYAISRSINASYNVLDPATNGVQPPIVYELVIIPTPASAALLFMAGVVAARRRR